MSRLNDSIARVLLALRAGDMDSDALYERFGNGNGIKPAVQRGWIVLVNKRYALTPAGFAACPNRRDLQASLRRTGQGRHAAGAEAQ
ncbi:MAG: hypothetical protein PXX73_04730 [Sideroxydans sp.]|nr:hypothetical protein [Sideroxydans sp.]